jgi:hypothetical protein
VFSVVPKNFRSMGGGGGGGGGGGQFGGQGTTVAAVSGFGLAEVTGLGIATTGVEFAEKILRPLPEYSTDSVTSMASMCRVGSSAAEVVPTGLAAFPGDVLPAGAGLSVEAADVGAAATGAEPVLDGVPPEKSSS